MTHKKWLLAALGLILVLVMAACAPASEEEAPAEEEEMAEEMSLADLEGDVAVDGSSTVFPITQGVAEEFLSVAPRVRVPVGVSGTGGGFEKFCAGETDISDASRPIKGEEADICAENGIEWTEYLVGLDGLTVMVNPENDFVECLSAADLASILGANSEISTWADINSDWPDEDILFYIPDPDSGTRDYMIEVVEGENGDEDLRTDENTTFSTDDNVLLDGIANEPNGFGFFGFAYYVENQDTVRAVPIENSDGDCVLPEDSTVSGGTYNPLARPLFIYANNESAQRPEVFEFLKFYFETGGPLVTTEVGYSLPPAGTYENNLAVLTGEEMMEEEMAEEEEAPAGEIPSFALEGAADLEGDVAVDGSSTVFPITQGVAEEFLSVAPRVRVPVGVSGTGGGFEKFCAGETDISDASRPVKGEEADICAENGIEFTEFFVAQDGLTVMVNPENDFVECLSAADLAAILGASTSVVTWADFNPDWPDEEILFYIPDPDSGTRDYMIEVVEGENGDEDLRTDENTTFATDDNVLLDGIANEPNGFGFFGFAYYIENVDSVKAVAIENSDGDCVLPEDATVQDGSYNPLARPLFIYVNNESLTRPEVAAFVQFYFSAEGGPTVVPEVGYSMPPAGTYQSNLADLE